MSASDDSTLKGPETSRLLWMVFVEPRAVEDSQNMRAIAMRAFQETVTEMRAEKPAPPVTRMHFLVRMMRMPSEMILIHLGQTTRWGSMSRCRPIDSRSLRFPRATLAVLATHRL
ncbi:hypothetical protein CKO27_17880 [Thiocystis violacea]|nr:hypothetical protein [Thiocystis violacea]